MDQISSYFDDVVTHYITVNDKFETNPGEICKYQAGDNPKDPFSQYIYLSDEWIVLMNYPFNIGDIFKVTGSNSGKVAFYKVRSYNSETGWWTLSWAE